MRDGYVYILSNKNRTTFYIGVTNNLRRRLEEHRSGLNPGFSSKYKLYYLVYFEHHKSISKAIRREKQLKAWKRAWKINLIRRENPNMDDIDL